MHTCWLLSRPAPVPPTPSRALPTRAARKWLARGPRVCRATGQPCGCWPALRDGVVLPFRPTPTQSDVICAAGPRCGRPEGAACCAAPQSVAMVVVAARLASQHAGHRHVPSLALHDRGAAVARRNDSCSLRNFLKQFKHSRCAHLFLARLRWWWWRRWPSWRRGALASTLATATPPTPPMPRGGGGLTGKAGSRQIKQTPSLLDAHRTSVEARRASPPTGAGGWHVAGARRACRHVGCHLVAPAGPATGGGPRVRGDKE